ncbi:PAS domain-containing protein [Aureococcus anophagefferens]|nr:PAS domain-containing protein [Aureococcus anophagefferens]
MQSFARTVEAAASAPSLRAQQPLRRDVPRRPRAKVVTTAPPFVIANVNQAWLDLCGFGKDEVLRRTMSCIQGELTDRRAVESVHAAVAAGRAMT